MLALTVLIPLLAWGWFHPAPAAMAHLSVVGVFELILLFEWKLNGPRFGGPDEGLTGQQMMLQRYHQFLRNPAGAVGLSRICSVIALFSLPWPCLLLWHRSWVLAVFTGLNYFLAATLASVLNPLSSLEHAAARHPAAGIQLAAVKYLYERRIADLDGSSSTASAPSAE